MTRIHPVPAGLAHLQTGMELPRPLGIAYGIPLAMNPVHGHGVTPQLIQAGTKAGPVPIPSQGQHSEVDLGLDDP